VSNALYTAEYAQRASKLYKSSINDSFHRTIMELLKPSEEDVILEIGCNFGDLVKQLRPLCREVKGIDINKAAIEASDCPGLHHMSATEIDFPDKHFTKIVSLHTIEHIPELKKAFLEMERLLRPGGTAVLAYPFEPIRGIGCIGSAIFIHKNIFAARKMHVNKLNGKKIKELVRGTNLMITRHKLHFTPWPVFITTLVKRF
jgi:SAM-dependent methyltransferase